MGTPAWQVRESERQDVLDALLNRVYRKMGEKDEEKNYLHRISIVLLLHLSGQKENLHILFGSEGYFVESQILPRIKEFARAPEEYSLIVSRLLEKVVSSIGSEIQSKLNSLELENPHTTLLAERMEEIE